MDKSIISGVRRTGTGGSTCIHPGKKGGKEDEETNGVGVGAIASFRVRGVLDGDRPCHEERLLHGGSSAE